jgi:hypothetical protein
MIEQSVSLASNGVVKVPGYEQLVRFGYTKNRGVYRLAITATGAQPIPALSGVNTVITDVDSVTVTGRADPIKRITDLEDAVASMTNT